MELLDNPQLERKPFAVRVSSTFSLVPVMAHIDIKVGKGVLTTASYEARKFGVRSGMAGK